MGLISLSTSCFLLGCLLLGKLGEAAAANKTSVRSRCPPDTLSLHGYCFQIIDDCVPWPEAYSMCSLMASGGHLATIRNEEELNVLAAYARGVSLESEFWIGLSLASSQLWRWADGTRNKFSAWAHQPLSFEGSCAAMRLSFEPAWVARSCATCRHFICQFQG